LFIVQRGFRKEKKELIKDTIYTPHYLIVLLVVLFFFG